MPSRTIPGPKGRWLIGDTLEYERDRLGWLERTRELYGDVVRLAPGTVVVHDPAIIRTVLTSSTAASGHASMTGRDSLNSPEWTASLGQVWRQLNRTVISAHLSRIKATYSAQIEASSGTQVDVFEFAFDMCASATVDFCVGSDGADPELIQAVKALSRSLIRLSATPEPTVRWLPRPAARQATGASTHLKTLLLAHVTRRRAMSCGAGADLLGLLPLEMPSAQAAEVLRIVLMASPGSPAVAASWALLRLAAHPGEITESFVKEVLRLHPPSWLLGRQTLSTMELGGHTVPAGATVLIPVYHVHRDPRWWQLPSEFSPSRWSGASAPHAAHAYLPFGAGRNTCPGSHLAMAQLTSLLQTMTQGYQLTLPNVESVLADPQGLLFPTGLHSAGLTSRWDARP